MASDSNRGREEKIKKEKSARNAQRGTKHSKTQKDA